MIKINNFEYINLSQKKKIKKKAYTNKLLLILKKQKILHLSQYI
jgi:hypothetical protein